jgi:Flp pilus assembly protein CpaB
VLGVLVLATVGAIAFINSQDQPQEEVTPVGEGTPQSTGDGDTQVELPPTSTPELVGVVVSLQTVPRGHQMTEDILTFDMRRADEVPDNVITDKNDVIDRFARTDIFQGETLTMDALVGDPTAEGVVEFGPSSLIPQGFIAMSLPIEDTLAGVAYAMDEGDFVDIMLTFDIYRIDQEFQTYLENDAVLIGITEGMNRVDEFPETISSTVGLFSFAVIENFGRVEELANGDLAIISPSEPQRPVRVGIVLQNAKIIQVGAYSEPLALLDRLPTPTPEIVEEGEGTPTPGPVPVPTSTPVPPGTLVVALAPQQQLLLKHAVDVGADIDFALRGSNDNQLYAVQNIDLGFFLDLFDIEIPPDFDHTLLIPVDESGNPVNPGPATPTPLPDTGGNEPPPDS